MLTKLVYWLLIVSSLGLCLYPVASTLQNNARLAEVSRQYEDIINETSVEVNREEIMAARQYNAELTMKPFAPPPLGQDATHPGYAAYADLLTTPGGVMGTLAIPDVDINLPIYHGTSDDVLRRGIGHLYGTHLPVGGRGTTSALAAHTGLASASMFDNLRFMKDGDSAWVRVRNEVLHYVKVAEKVVPPDATDAITTDPERDLLQLITCTPYGINSDRLIVTLERAPLPDPLPSDASPGAVDNIIGGWQWWMYVCIGLASIILAAQVPGAVRAWRRRAAGGRDDRRGDVVD